MLSEILSPLSSYAFMQATQKYVPTRYLKSYCQTKFQNYQMRKLVDHAFHNSKFFHKFYTDYGIKEKDIQQLKVTDLPIMTKQHIIENKNDIYTDRKLNYRIVDDLIYKPDSKPFFKKNYLAVVSSGSSGVPTSIVYSRSEWQKILGHLFLTSQAVKPKNTKKIKVAALVLTPKSTARINTALSVIRSIKSDKYNIKEISALHSLEEIVHILNEFQPDQVLGYSGLFLSLVPFQMSGKLNISPVYVGLGGEQLTPTNQLLIENTFKTKVMNSYGSSECMFIGAKHTDSEYFDMFPQCSILEILDENNQHVKPGEIGTVVATNFTNYTQPFIRYKIGDKAEFALNERNEPCIKRIVSREYKPIYFTSNDSQEASFHPYVLYDTLLMIPEVQNSQIILSKNKVRAYMVATDEGAATAERTFKKFLVEGKLDKTVEFDIERVDRILPDSNGKIPVIKYENLAMS